MALISEIRRLREALEQIAKPGYGLEFTDTIEYQAEYWAKESMRKSTIAREALASPSEEEIDLAEDLNPDLEPSEIFGDANFSADGLYRWRLRRSWDGDRTSLTFIMLNPSTADAEKDDATIRKCMGFAHRLGHGGIVVVNLFAYRATDPRELKKVADPVGSENDEWIREAVNRNGGLVVAAWGAKGGQNGRDAEVLKRLWDLDREVYALRITSKGAPEHPLYIPYDTTPVLYRSSRSNLHRRPGS